MLNLLHQLQAANLLKRLELAPETARQTAGRNGRNLWQSYLAEGVFEITQADWAMALPMAIALNDKHSGPPPPPLLLLHPALAAITGATEFLSFEPRSRAVAQALGLKVLPARL